MDNAAIRTSDWRSDPDAYDPSAGMCRFTLDGVDYTAHSIHGTAGDDWPFCVRRNGQYVGTVSNWRRMPEQLRDFLSRK